MTAAPLNAVEQSQADRLIDIARQIRSAVAPVVDADEVKKTAQDTFQEEVGKSTNARELVMGTLASLAKAGNWTEKEIESAAKTAVTIGNAETPKAIATFIGECKTAMHPKARDFVPGITDLRDKAWAEETDVLAVDKEADAPLRKAFARKYHMLRSMLARATEGTYFRTTTDVVAWAEGLDPDLSPKAVAKKLERMVKDLTVMYRHFAHDDIKASLDQLAGVDEKALKALIPTTKPSTTVVQSAAQPTVAPPTIVVDNATSTTPSTAPTAQPGAFDIDDVLNELAA